MLIVYDCNTSEIVSISGFREEVSSEIIDSIDVADLPAEHRKFRVYDYELIQQIFKAQDTNGTITLVRDDNGEVVGVEAVEGTPQPEPPTMEERLEALEFAMLDLLA